ncbi:hypothetical protein BGZ59_009333 [Podila verticillata]|nr:hypothetical protein BGZ59_009333 [Podila verticillata]KFH63711.1 hypothetical protein MVEG_10404 [Podila verticillata NRRL 6337]
MKFAAASLALVAAVSAQAIGPVDPSKLANGWCSTVTVDSCMDTVAPTACGANSTVVSHCKAVFSSDKVCMSFTTSCTCQPQAGGAVKDISFEAFNETFSMLPYDMCGNLQWIKNATGPGIVSGDYKPDGKRPAANATTAVPNSASSSASTGSPTSTDAPKSAGSSIQIAVSTMALAAISLGLAMI